MRRCETNKKKVPEKKYIEDLIQLTVDAVGNGVKLKLPTGPQFTKTN